MSVKQMVEDVKLVREFLERLIAHPDKMYATGDDNPFIKIALEFLQGSRKSLFEHLHEGVFDKRGFNLHNEHFVEACGIMQKVFEQYNYTIDKQFNLVETTRYLNTLTPHVQGTCGCMDSKNCESKKDEFYRVWDNILKSNTGK